MWRRVLLAALAARIAAAVRGCCRCCCCCCCCQRWRWSFAAQPPKLLAAPAACRANAAACTHPRACADHPGPPMLLLCCCFCCSEAQDAQGAGPGAAEGRHHHADAGRQVGASWMPPRRPGPSLVAARQQQPAPAAATNWRAANQLAGHSSHTQGVVLCQESVQACYHACWPPPSLWACTRAGAQPFCPCASGGAVLLLQALLFSRSAVPVSLTL